MCRLSFVCTLILIYSFWITFSSILKNDYNYLYHNLSKKNTSYFYRFSNHEIAQEQIIFIYEKTFAASWPSGADALWKQLIQAENIIIPLPQRLVWPSRPPSFYRFLIPSWKTAASGKRKVFVWKVGEISNLKVGAPWAGSKDEWSVCCVLWDRDTWPHRWHKDGRGETLSLFCSPDVACWEWVVRVILLKNVQICGNML